jgi:hypothetical protein
VSGSKANHRGGSLSGAADARARIPEPDVIGHGLLSRFHAGCQCAWCTTQARERACGCQSCTQSRSLDPYFHLERAGSRPWLQRTGTERNLDRGA